MYSPDGGVVKPTHVIYILNNQCYIALVISYLLTSLPVKCKTIDTVGAGHPGTLGPDMVHYDCQDLWEFCELE